jgi:apolipoprotein N-acyltransferase
MRTSHTLKLVIAFLAGGITIFAFSPFNISYLAFLTPAILLLLWLNSSYQRATVQGFVFGLGMFGFGVSWVFISIHRYGGTGILLSSLFTLGFVALLSSMLAIQGYVLNRFWPKNNLRKILIAFPTSWVLMEWVRGWLFTGFPWLYLGTTQVHGILGGFAPLVGTYGTSFFVVFVAALIVALLYSRKLTRLFAFVTLVVVILLGITLKSINWTKPIDAPLPVALVQGDIPQQLMWSDSSVIQHIQKYIRLTKPYWQTSLIVWPENTIPVPLTYAGGILNPLQKALLPNGALLTGIPVPTSQGETYYNSMLGLGNTHGLYHKRHLVPFGEYVPFAQWLRGLITFFNLPMSSFVPGEAHQKLFRLHHIYIAPYVCYEIAYSHLVLSDLPKANLLVVISNDAWFGDSIAAWQHLQIAQMQALSAGRPVLFTTNNGITAIVNAKGKLQKTAPRFKAVVLRGSVQPMIGETPWVFLGDWPILLMLFAGLLCSWRRID